MAKLESFRLKVLVCARCRMDHDDVEFLPLTEPTRTFTHWAICPELGEPILFRQVNHLRYESGGKRGQAAQ